MSSSLAGKRLLPLLDRILKTASGIFIPEKAQETLNRGEVLAVGPGGKDHPVTLKAGDHVILPSYGGSAVKDSKISSNEVEELFIYRESEILAKIEN